VTGALNAEQVRGQVNAETLVANGKQPRQVHVEPVSCKPL
jgi:hypothetical protein